MNNELRKTINRWWTTVGLLLLYICFNGYSRTQQWEFILPGFEFQDFEPRAAALIAIFMILPLTYALCQITKFYSEHAPCTNKISLAFPSAFDSNIDSSYPISQKYQLVFIFLFVIFPFISSIHFFKTFWVACLDMDYCMSWNGFSVLFTNDFSFHGITFFPFFEPITISLVFLGNIYFLSIMFYYAKKSVGKAMVVNKQDAPPEDRRSEDKLGGS